jgi:hypothetical protein
MLKITTISYIFIILALINQITISSGHQIPPTALEFTQTCFEVCTCTEDRTKISCTNFESFENLIFDEQSAEVTHLIIEPSRKLRLTKSLNLAPLRFASNAIIQFNNLDGLDLDFDIFPPQQSTNKTSPQLSLSLYIDNSNIFIVEEDDKLIDKSPIFSLFSNIRFLSGNTFVSPVTPLAFKNSIRLSLTFYNLNYSAQNGFYVGDLAPSELANFSADVRAIEFIECDLDELSTRILNPYVFKNLNSLIVNAAIKSIEADLFFNFKRMF